MYTNLSKDENDYTLPMLERNLIKYQNTYFAIQALLYSKLDQMWDGSMSHTSLLCQLEQHSLLQELLWKRPLWSLAKPFMWRFFNENPTPHFRPRLTAPCAPSTRPLLRPTISLPVNLAMERHSQEPSRASVGYAWAEARVLRKFLNIFSKGSAHNEQHSYNLNLVGT